MDVIAFVLILVAAILFAVEFIRSNWQSHETVTLKYSKWIYGKHTHSDSWDARPRAQLDDQMLGLAFGMWW